MSNEVEANGLLGKMHVWNKEFLTNPDTVLEEVDLGNISVSTYLLFADEDESCPYELNQQLMESIADKRSITYSGGHLLPYIGDPDITNDVITILGSSAHSLVTVASASVIAFLSLQ